MLTQGLELLQSIQQLSFSPSLSLTLMALLHSANFSQLNIKIHLHRDNCLPSTQHCISRPHARALWPHSDNAQWLPATESVFTSRVIISYTRKSPSFQIISAKSLWYSSPWHVARQTGMGVEMIWTEVVLCCFSLSVTISGLQNA